MNAKFPHHYRYDFFARAFGIAEPELVPPARVLRRRRVPTAGVPGDRDGDSEDTFAITVNENTIGVVSVDLERGASERRKESPRDQQS
jgi:hypothetical protein